MTPETTTLALTSQPYTGRVTVIAKDGERLDSVVTNSPSAGTGEIGVAFDRPGTYTVVVRAPDYLDHTIQPVTARSGECAVETVHLEARIVRDTITSISALYQGRGEFSDPNLVRVRFTATSFVLDIASPNLWPMRFGIPNSGTATVRYSLITPGNDTIASYTSSLPLQSGYRYDVSGYVLPKRPAGMCGDAVAFPLRGTAGTLMADSLFVVLGGLPLGAVC